MNEEGLLLSLSEYLTLSLLVIALVIFVWLSVKSRSIRSFRFQTSIFIAVMVAGAIVELLSNDGLIQLPSTFQELGFLIHVGSMIFFSLMMWMRYYASKRGGKKMIEEIQE